jgi:NADPH:quinone reductase-like Zn-dependent oxidoreductase
VRRVIVRERGGPDVLEIEEIENPEPGAGEIRVRTLAAGVSAHDLMLRQHWFPGFPRLPYRPGVDVVGVVDAVARDVDGIAPGAVIAALLPDGGGHAESVCLPAEMAVEVPPGADPVGAACVATNYVTAHAMMHRTAQVRSGERILVHGAAGGVGTALLELGALAGLEMYGTASAHNHDVVRNFAATPIDYRNEDFVARIRELTGDGVDVVFDPIGGSRQLRRSYRALRKGGRLVWFGVAGVARSGTRVIVGSLFQRSLLALRSDGKKALMPPTADKPRDRYREALAELLDLLAAGKIDPLVAARFPLRDVRRAHELLERGGYAGKVVLTA